MNMTHILFVDDDLHQAASIGTSLIGILLENDIQLEIVTDANKVIEGYSGPKGSKLRGAVVDLWMVDKVSHDEDREMGLKVISSLRKHFPSLPVVILSAHLDDEKSKQFQSIGNIKVIKKPASAREVLEALLSSAELQKGCANE